MNNTVYAVTDKADGSRYLMYISSPIPNMRDNVFFLDKFIIKKFRLHFLPNLPIY